MTTEQNATDPNEAMALHLEACGTYRVLRRLDLAACLRRDEGARLRLGIMLDLETTGLDPNTDEIIQFAMVPFAYSEAGHVVSVQPAFDRLRQPSMPISERITQLTGINDAMVAGQIIDPNEVAAFIEPADLIIAHNARFDRRFAERFCTGFATKPWACSMAQIDWQAAGYEGAKLGYLLKDSGYFNDRHRALDDCHAAVALLARDLQGSEEPALARLLAAAERPVVRIWATGAPYARKDALKERGYRWSSGEDGRPRAWYIDVDQAGRDVEVAFLREELFGAEHCPPETLITAYERFSERA